MNGPTTVAIGCASDEGGEAATPPPGVRITSMPQEIRLEAEGRLLRLVWSRDSQAALLSTLLRQRCGCAECRSFRRAGRRMQLAGDLHICVVKPCGPGAVQLIFSDGHSRGIFPFAYLASLASQAGDDTRD